MPIEEFESHFLDYVGLVITLKCPIECAHCILEAGPHRSEEIGLKNSFLWISQIADYCKGAVKGIILTGGEPFCNLEQLCDIIKFSNERKLKCSVVTNAFWAKNETDAKRVLMSLPSLEFMGISTDIYHQESIPVLNVKNAIIAAKACAIPYKIIVCTESKKDPRYLDILKELSTVTDNVDVKTAIIIPVGRGASTIFINKFQSCEESPEFACNVASTPVIFPDGNVYGCIGPFIHLPPFNPMLLGNINSESLNDIFDRAQKNPILHAIRIWGPKRIAEILRENDMGEYLPKKYVANSLCNACYTIFKEPKICRYFEREMHNPKFVDYVSEGRKYYLDE